MNDNKNISCVGPDGKTLTLRELPAPTVKRWVMRRKAMVVAAVKGGLLSQKEACQRYGLSDEEFANWTRLYDEHGKQGLRTTRLKLYREAV